MNGSVRDVFSSELRDEVYVSRAWEPPAIWHSAIPMCSALMDDKPPFDLAPCRHRAPLCESPRRHAGSLHNHRPARLAGHLSNPVLATAYGAYQFSWTPRFEPRLFAFLDAGGIFVVANVRGGGEYGRRVAQGRPKGQPNPTPGATSSTFPRR